MRRSDEEFKTELFRRCSEYKKAQKKRRRIITGVCTLSALCVFSLSAALILTQPNDIQLLEINKDIAESDTATRGTVTRIDEQDKYFCGSADCGSEQAPTTDQQEEQILSFYHQHKEQLNKIKDCLWEDKYSVREIRDDGYIRLTDGSALWLADISPLIKQIFNDGEEYNIRAIYYDDQPEKAFRIEAFYPENDVVIELVYSLTDLTADSNMYSHIEDNWYLFVAGMT